MLEPQESDPCAKVLMQDVNISYASKNEIFSMLNIVDKRNYESFKKSFGAAVTVPIDGIPVQFGGSYEEFSEKRSSLFVANKFDMSRQESSYHLQYNLSKTAVNAWLECRKLRAKSSEGFHVWADVKDPKNVIIHYFLNVPPTAEREYPVAASTSRGGEPGYPNVSTGEAFPAGSVLKDQIEQIQHWIRDDPETSLIITVNTDAGAAFVHVPPYRDEGGNVKLEWTRQELDLPTVDFNLSHRSGDLGTGSSWLAFSVTNVQLSVNDQNKLQLTGYADLVESVPGDATGAPAGDHSSWAADLNKTFSLEALDNVAVVRLVSPRAAESARSVRDFRTFQFSKTGAPWEVVNSSGLVKVWKYDFGAKKIYLELGKATVEVARWIPVEDSDE